MAIDIILQKTKIINKVRLYYYKLYAKIKETS